MHPMYVALNGVTLCVVIRLQLQLHPAVSFLLLLSLQFPSVQDGVFVLRKTHNSVIQPVSQVFSTLPWKFQYSSYWWWPFHILSSALRKQKQKRLSVDPMQAGRRTLRFCRFVHWWYVPWCESGLISIDQLDTFALVLFMSDWYVQLWCWLHLLFTYFSLTFALILVVETCHFLIGVTMWVNVLGTMKQSLCNHLDTWQYSGIALCWFASDSKLMHTGLIQETDFPQLWSDHFLWLPDIEVFLFFK